MLYKRNSNDSIDFYSQLFQTKELQSKSHGYGNGILDIRMRIPMSNLNLFPLPIPPSGEQHKIISVLNDRGDRIERLIKVQEQQIERFEELKLAIVHRALTKGLNPNIIMKNSGQYMINQIPNDFQLFKIKGICKIQNGKEIDFEGGHVPVYGSGGVFKYTNKALFNGKSVLLGRKGTIDKPQYVEGEFWSIDTAFYTIINEKIIIPKFFYYASLVEIDYGFFKSGSVKPSMTQTDLGTIIIAVPSIEKQVEILKYISIQEKKIDDFLNNKRLKIEKLNEYKNSLIYECVTGKIEV
jgi:type I restriction enzyme S subunit